LPVLRSATQGQLLAHLAEHPDQAFGIRELAELVGTSATTAQREVDRAETAGVVTSHEERGRRLVRINPDHALYLPLRQLLVSTFGVPHVIADEFSLLEGTRLIVLFGSWAARYEGIEGPSPHDIDVLVLGDGLDRQAADDAARRCEVRLSLPVQVTVRPEAAWSDSSDPFLATVRSRPYLVVHDRRGAADGAS
jgi:predicted nucleotidyltransferase